METETKALWVTTREAMGKTWRIELWPDDVALGRNEGKSEALGRSWYSDQWIKVAANRPLDGRDQTLLHEVLHLVAANTSTRVSESDITAFANGLYAFLRGFGLWQEFPWPDKDGASGVRPMQQAATLQTKGDAIHLPQRSE